MSDYGGSSTQEGKRDLWRTPVEIFDSLDIEFGFWLDAAASWENTLCAQYLDEKANALACEWVSYGSIWVNPPYSNIAPWVVKAAEQCQALRSVDEIRFITDGRVQFIPEESTSRRLSNPKGSMLFIWRPFIRPRCQFTTVSRESLLNGSAINQQEKHNERT